MSRYLHDIASATTVVQSSHLPVPDGVQNAKCAAALCRRPVIDRDSRCNWRSLTQLTTPSSECRSTTPSGCRARALPSPIGLVWDLLRCKISCAAACGFWGLVRLVATIGASTGYRCSGFDQFSALVCCRVSLPRYTSARTLRTGEWWLWPVSVRAVTIFCQVVTID